MPDPQEPAPAVPKRNATMLEVVGVIMAAIFVGVLLTAVRFIIRAAGA